jgi:hypothetical protein
VLQAELSYEELQHFELQEAPAHQVGAACVPAEGQQNLQSTKNFIRCIACMDCCIVLIASIMELHSAKVD